MNNKIIVALDYPTEKKALALVDQLQPDLCRLKVGKELFVATGRSFVEKLIARGFDVFLDLKFYDIPNTVASVIKVVANMGVWMVNVHASGGERMMLAAVDALQEKKERPLLIAVTVLTSMSDQDLQALGIRLKAEEQVLMLASLAKQSGLDGVVCSAQEVEKLKKQLGSSFLAVTPGIRPLGSSNDDQSRIMTPEKAIASGVDYLVIGRPVTQADNPVKALLDINQSIYGTEGRT